MSGFLLLFILYNGFSFDQFILQDFLLRVCVCVCVCHFVEYMQYDSLCIFE